MTKLPAYEVGARKHPPAHGGDPSDAFSQAAAGNKPPPNNKDTSKEISHPGDKSSSPEPKHNEPAPRDVREAPAPNPNGHPVKKDDKSSKE